MQLNQSIKWRALKFDLRSGTKLKTEVEVSSECLYDLYVNGNLYATVVLTPFQLEEWAIGFLYSEGLINSTKDVNRVLVGDDSIEIETISAEDMGFQNNLKWKVSLK